MNDLVLIAIASLVWVCAMLSIAMPYAPRSQSTGNDSTYVDVDKGGNA